MVSRAPQHAADESKPHQGITMLKSNKTFVKETHKEDDGLGLPQQLKDGGHVGSRAQDVAELKDYVRGLVIFRTSSRNAV